MGKNDQKQDVDSNDVRILQAVLDRPDVATPRIRKLRRAYFESKTHISADRPHLVTLSWKETEGQHVYIRRAKLFARICQDIDIVIQPGELIVGSQTKYLRGCSPQLDYAAKLGEDIVNGCLDTRTEAVHGVIAEEDLRLIKEDTPYWQGRDQVSQLYARMKQVFGERLDQANRLMKSGYCHYVLDEPRAGFLRAADYEKILKIGLKGIMEEARQELARLDMRAASTVDKAHFLRSVIIALEGMVTLARRYSKLAGGEAARENDPVRKKELEAIAEACAWVPENPARSFQEAVQCFRLIHLGLNLETGYSHVIVARLDQYLYPFFRKDLLDGKLTVEQAGELVASLFVKINEMDNVKSRTGRQANPGDNGSQVTIGGVDRDGKDATNPLSYLILEVTRQLKFAQPSVYARIHSKTPDEFMIRALEANRDVGGGIPAFTNDDRVIPNMVADGIALEDAREYAIVGCAHPYVPHSSGSYKHYPFMNGAKALEHAMYDGWDPKMKMQVGPHTGDPRTFAGIDDWVDAVKKQWESTFLLLQDVACAKWHVEGQTYALPFNSALMNDCIKKGSDILRDGMRYLQLCSDTYNRMYINVGDSLEAIKKLVYDEKKLTVDELLEACAGNFEGKEDLRQMLLSAPKYGNDDDEADGMMREMSVWSGRLVRSQKNPFGYPTRDCRNGVATHIHSGGFVSALPDGRKAWEPLSDGAISPMRGCDTKGPTAVLLSASKIIDVESNRTAILNQKFSPALVNTRENIMKVVHMIRTFFEDLNGYEVQYNILSKDTLLKAKAHPEEYRDLVIRIGGYSAYFIELTPKVQDEIIARTEQVF